MIAGKAAESRHVMADQYLMDKLTTAVLEEAIGPDIESIQAVAENGVADTTHYCYTSHCYTFYEQHTDALWQMAEDAAGELGQTIWEFIAALNTYGAEGQNHLVTGLVWYAMETICQRAMDSMPECESCGEYYKETESDTGYCSEKCYNKDNAEESYDLVEIDGKDFLVNDYISGIYED